jgi:WD40 repeat protein
MREDGSLNQTMRVKMSGSAADAGSLQCLWAGDGTLATTCNESMVRVWDLRQDENYMLSLHDTGIQRKSQSDRITRIAYHKQRGMLAAATKDGMVVFWRYVGMASAEEDASSAWSAITSVDLNAKIDHLVWGPRPELLGAGFVENVTVRLKGGFDIIGM